jgi:MerR family transcriptional regulator, repressor of the yfmOP operon
MNDGEQLDSDEQTLYTIDQVATRTGFTKRTLRYYEELGLLAPAGRTEGNYRRYGDSDIERLDYIKKLRDLLGFSLTDIGKLLEVRDERNQIKMAYKQETDAAAKIAQLDRGDELIHTQLQLIEQKLAGLEQMRAALIEQLERHNQKRQELLDL